MVNQIDFRMLNQPCIYGINLTWSWIVFAYYSTQFVNILVKIFVPNPDHILTLLDNTMISSYLVSLPPSSFPPVQSPFNNRREFPKLQMRDNANPLIKSL